MGLHLAIVQRTLAMLRRVGADPPLLFAGGVAYNSCVRKIRQEQLEHPVTLPENPGMVEALGAALHGRTLIAPNRCFTCAHPRARTTSEGPKEAFNAEGECGIHRTRVRAVTSTVGRIRPPRQTGTSFPAASC
jgi:sugar (pentulose or hexulose) kinase